MHLWLKWREFGREIVCNLTTRIHNQFEKEKPSLTEREKHRRRRLGESGYNSVNNSVRASERDREKERERERKRERELSIMSDH